MIAVGRIAKVRVHETSLATAGAGDHLKKRDSQYLMLQIKVSQDTPRDHFTKEKTAISMSCRVFCCPSHTLSLFTGQRLPTLPPYSLEQECICDMYHAPRPHTTTEESKFSSLYCLGHALPSNQNISEAFLQTPLCSHSIFPLNYCGLLATAQFLWENRLCCTSEWKTDQVKGERRGRKIVFRFLETYNSFWKDNWKQAIDNRG